MNRLFVSFAPMTTWQVQMRTIWLKPEGLKSCIWCWQDDQSWRDFWKVVKHPTLKLMSNYPHTFSLISFSELEENLSDDFSSWTLRWSSIWKVTLCTLYDNPCIYSLCTSLGYLTWSFSSQNNWVKLNGHFLSYLCFLEVVVDKHFCLSKALTCIKALTW